MILKYLFSPKSIAVVGASSNPEKIGHQILKKLFQAKNTKIFPVNPKRKEILKLTCYPSILDIKDNLDLVIIVIPAFLIPEIIEQCVIKKVGAIVIVSSGFSEIGPVGQRLEQKIKQLLKNTNISLLGPNCLGFANPNLNLDITFAKTSPLNGNIALVSQSGAIGSFLFDWAKKENLGFSKFLSLGNRAGLTETDLLENLKKDSNTKVIGLYLESFANGSDFLKIVSRVTKIKPIIVLFGGKTELGKQAVKSHTAALSPKSAIINTVLEQSGCIQAKSLEEFTDLLEIFSLQPKLLDNDIAIITNAGGPGILAADQISKEDLKLTNLKDVYGDALAEQFKVALANLTADKKSDAFLVIISPQTNTELELTAKVIVEQFKVKNKPVIVCLLGAKTMSKAKQYLQKQGIATIDFPNKAITYLNKLYHYYSNRNRQQSYPVRLTKLKNITKKTLQNLKLGEEKGMLSWVDSKKLGKIYQLPLIKTITLTKDNLNQTIKDFGYPFVLKADPTEAIHRTEKKGLRLNLKSKSAISKAHQDLSKNFKIILAQPQVSEGVELFIGLKREPNLPPMITLGSGGIYTEVYQDVAQAFLPLNKKMILQLIKQTKIGQIILGVRSLPPLALDKIIKMLLGISQMAMENEQIKELDINPAIISQTKVTIVDIKISV
ncbi:MAG: acetate--CoA ligase family protein [Candidatus Beckwithbacteria bacterium]|nr:acetate--CoA ligase family protein [Patescibacteria group bacterium]